MLLARNEAILAIDTSTQICSVALEIDKTHHTQAKNSGRDQLSTLLPTIRNLLTRTQVSIGTIGLCVCSRGPGSFVGLRIAMSTVKGFHGALGIPFVTVPTHEIYRHIHTHYPHPTIAVIQATKTVLYTAAYYRGHELLPIQEMDLSSTRALITKLRAAYPQAEPVVTSVDADLLRHIAEETNIATRPILSSAMALCEIGRNMYEKNGMDELAINPYYLRTIDAEKQ